MSELSPAAQTVLDAYHQEAIDYIEEWGTFRHKRGLAAALRAAADQVLPEVVNAVGDEHDDARRDQWVRIRCRFLAIAAELEA
jgi:hypothetical protein